MIINMVGGNGGGASGMNFKVVCSASQPSNPSENTIWVKSSTATGAWSMIDSADLSSVTSEGYVVISYEASNTSDRTFNALKKNELAVKLTKCYQRVSSKWVSMNAYIYANGNWEQFSSEFKAYIAVTYPAGSICTVTNGSVQFTAPNTSGSYTFMVPSIGAWTVSCTNGTDSTASIVSITADGQTKSVSLTYSTIPTFTYTGDYDIVNDAGETISVSKDNWNIRLLTSGDLTFQDLKNASSGADVFLVGGGGGGSAVGAYPYNTSLGLNMRPGSPGGGSGYTKTYSNVSVALNTPYTATIGAGGAVHTDGGQSSFVVSTTTYTADGGKCSTYNAHGGPGGSGGGAGGCGGTSGSGAGSNGGVDGANGGDGIYQNLTLANGGVGQGTTTRAFGEATGVLYATGGAGGGLYGVYTGANLSQGIGGGDNPNTGDGGKGGGWKEAGGTATAGGSGIIIIRNHRTA